MALNLDEQFLFSVYIKSLKLIAKKIFYLFIMKILMILMIVIRVNLFPLIPLLCIKFDFGKNINKYALYEDGSFLT